MEAIEEIKKRIDIVDYIGSFITLKKTGRNFKALCPFHQEKTPSFVVSPDRQIWHCFGSCNEGGDIIRFLMKWENITFIEALRELAEKSGVKIEKVTFEDKVYKKKEKLIKINNLATEFYNYILAKTDFGKKALDYLDSRGINKKISEKFQLGYAPKSWDSLYKFLKSKKFDDFDIVEGGLAIRRQGSPYDRFRGRIMFPIKDQRGETIGFSGRSLDADEKEAKYINTPESPIYHKRESLYGINLAKEAIKKEKNVYLVEGEFDVITPYEHGIENIVAIKGSAVTREQLMFLKRYTEKVTLALDADNTGEEAIKRAIENAEDLGFEMGVVTFDFAKDPDEAIRKDFEKFKKAIKKSVSIYDFIIDHAKRLYPDDDAYSKKKIGDLVVPYIEKITNPIIQSHYVKKIADILDVGEEGIEILIKRIRADRRKRSLLKVPSRIKQDELRETNIQKYVLSLLFQNKDPYGLYERIYISIEPKDFSIPSYEKIFSAFLEYKTKHASKFDLHKFVNNLDSSLRATFDEIFLYATYEEDFSDLNTEKLLNEIKKYSLKRQIMQTLEQKEIKKEEQDRLLKDLSLKLKEVEKKLIVV